MKNPKCDLCKSESIWRIPQEALDLCENHFRRIKNEREQREEDAFAEYYKI